MLRDLHYGWPWASYFLLGAFFLFILFVYLYRYRQKTLNALAAEPSREEIVIARSLIMYWIQTVCFCLGWVFGILAFMQPLGNGHYPEGALSQNFSKKKQEAVVRRKAHEVVLLLDASASMNIKDTRTEQSRLDYAKAIADELISQLSGETVSLYAFTADLTPMSPPTLDYLFVRLMLKETQINEGNEAGTVYAPVLANLRKRLLSEPLSQLKTVILLSDGGDTGIEALKGEEKQKKIDGLVPLVSDGQLWNMRLYSVGFGSKKGEEVPHVKFEGHSVRSAQDEDILRTLSQSAQGTYYDSNTYSVLGITSELLKAIDKSEAPIEEHPLNNAFLKLISGDNDLVYNHYFQIPLGLCLAFFFLALYLPEVRFTRASAWMLGLILPWTLEGQMREVQTAFEARQYEKSDQILQKMLREFADSWQREVLLYDQGTLYLYQGEWDKALAAFVDVPLEADLSPVLYMHTKINSGVAYLEKGRMLISEGIIHFNKVLYCYRSALRAFEDAGNAACHLQQWVAEPSCWPLGDIPMLKVLAKEELATLLTQYPEFMRSYSNLRQGTLLLSSAIQKTLDHARFIDSMTVDDKWRSRYVDFFKESHESWMPMWNAQQGLWKKEIVMNPLLDKGFTYFSEAYSEYSKAQSIFGGLKTSEVWQFLEKAAIALNKTLQFLEKENPGADNHTESPINALENLLNAQGEALELTVSFSFSAEKNKETMQPKFPVVEAQKNVISLAELFPAQVFAYQIKKYRGSLPPRCQARPWDEVLPLFEEGFQSAQTAAEALKKNSHKWRSVIFLQEKAYQTWERALILLKRPHDPKDTGGCQSNQQQKSDNSEKKEEQRSQSSTSTEDVLRLLQELDQQDQLPRSDRTKPNEGLRPW